MQWCWVLLLLQRPAQAMVTAAELAQLQEVLEVLLTFEEEGECRFGLLHIKRRIGSLPSRLLILPHKPLPCSPQCLPSNLGRISQSLPLHVSRQP